MMQRSLALKWHQNQFPMMGKSIPLPRQEAMFGDSESYFYIYSGSVELRAKLWTPFLLELRAQVEAKTGYKYQVAIGNHYRSAQDSIGYHADDEPTLGLKPAIASFETEASQSDLATPRSILLHLMEEHDLKQADLVGIIGSRGVVSEVVNGKRDISKAQASALAHLFHVDVGLFIG
jgi:antitoxin component HigA of HigAB toxin-antitoxin module